jgi:hypothetical protein
MWFLFSMAAGLILVSGRRRGIQQIEQGIIAGLIGGLVIGIGGLIFVLEYF